MKKLFNVFCVIAVAAVALMGCSKDSPLAEQQKGSDVSLEKKVTFNALPNVSTKSYFGDKDGSGKYPTIWTNVNKVAASLNLASKKEATVKPLTGGTSASFDVTLTDDGSGSYKFYLMSPASACLGVSSTYKSVTVEFPSAQTPSQKSVDEAAHIMVAKSSALTTFPDKVDVTFIHLAAYGRFQLKNFPETVRISSINIESAEPFAGRYYFYVEDNGTQHEGDLVANSTSNIMTLHLPDLYHDSDSNYDKVFWFSCAPVNLEGKTLKVSVNTDAGKYVKNITFPAGKGNFQSGKVASFNLDMSGIVPASEDIYTLVTSTDELLEDSEVIIVARDYNSALGTVQNANNRAAVGITKESTTPSTIKSPQDAGAQVFVLEAGTVANTIAFKCLNGSLADNYIYAASSTANYMRSSTTVDDNASFGLTLSADGTAVLVAKGTNTRNTLKYNNSSSVFSCYASTSSQLDVVLYKRNGSGSGSKLLTEYTADPVISYNAATRTVTITCEDPSAKIGYSIDGSDPGLDAGGSPLPGTLEYTDPFIIASTTTVKAFAGAPHKESSNIVTKVCTVSSGSLVTYTWTLAKGDLGEDNSPLASVTVGTMSSTSSAITWTPTYSWPSTNKRILWDSSNGRGVQIGTGSATNKCDQFVISTSGFTGNVTKIKIGANTASSGNADLSVKVGSADFECGGNTSVKLNTTSTPATYVFTGNSSGNIVITMTNNAAKALYLRSIEINID